MALRGQNPRYRGFRGYRQEDEPERAVLVAVTCSSCGRRRNVSPEVVQEQGERYVCLSCRDAMEAEESGGDGAEPPA